MSKARSLPMNIGNAMSLLTDGHIRAAHAQNYIFASTEDFSPERVRQASYELTLFESRGLRFEELKQVASHEDLSVLELPAFNFKDENEAYVVINPWQCCQLMSSEQIKLPDNVTGHVMARGQLFESGLVVESTYIDPGFGPGNIHLMAFNATQRQVKLPIGVAIARLELVRVAEDVEDPHGGRKNIKKPEMSQQAWPWPASLASHGEELAAARTLRDHDVRLLAMDRITNALGSLGDQIKARARRDAFLRIYLFVTTPVLLWLMIKAIDIRSYLNAGTQVKFDKAVQSIPGWIPWLIIAAIGAAIGVIVKNDVSVLLGISEKKDGK